MSVESNCDYTGFALPCSVIGLENYCQSLNHSNVETKPKTRSLTFSLTSGSLHVFTTCSRCLPVIFCFPMIGGCDYFGFGGTKLDTYMYIYIYIYVCVCVCVRVCVCVYIYIYIYIYII